jgi:hypothetical protein
MSVSERDSEELVLKIGSEGGSFNIQRFRSPDETWKFIFIIDESTIADFLEEEDQTDLVKKSLPVDTFEEAIQLMDKYPWREMHVLSVHPEYAEFTAPSRKTLKSRKRGNS